MKSEPIRSLIAHHETGLFRSPLDRKWPGPLCSFRLALPEEQTVEVSRTTAFEETQQASTGWMGALAVLAGAYVLARFRVTPQPGTWLEAAWNHRIALLIMAVFAVMATVELTVHKVHRRNFDFSRARPVDLNRVFARWMALLGCLAVAVVLYGTLAEYDLWQPSSSFFHVTYRPFLFVAVPALLVLSLPYFWIVERHARADGPVDDFLVLAGYLKQALAGLAPRDPRARNVALGLLVKFFFIPISLRACLGVWDRWEETGVQVVAFLPNMTWQTAGEIAANVGRIQTGLLCLLFAIDMTVTVIGYVVSVRLLDTQIASAEPTFSGWAAALACYPPFSTAVIGTYLSGQVARESWELQQMTERPTLSVLCSVAIIVLMSVYTWATFAFGLRFSNLTNRGIVCRGPYRFVRHPAYISKNIVWWVVSIPFLVASWKAGLLHAAHLAFISGLYFLRALTEERHLRRDPHYREYCRKVRWRFIPGCW
jgi:protein-S-isoprenylcysteine O-methyltransferase Ste14